MGSGDIIRKKKKRKEKTPSFDRSWHFVFIIERITARVSVNIGVPLGTVAEKIKVSDRDRYVSARYYIGCRCFRLYSNYAMHTNDHVEGTTNKRTYLSTIRVEARHIRERALGQLPRADLI